MEKKYEFTGETKVVDGHTVRRIQRTSGSFRAGGWIEHEDNLSHEGKCWVYHEAIVMGDACVKDDAAVAERAIARDRAVVKGRVVVEGDALIADDGFVTDFAFVSGSARILGEARVCGRISVGDDAIITANLPQIQAYFHSNARICSYKDYLVVQNIGSAYGTLTAYRTQNGGIDVTRGCFAGTLDEFVRAVEVKHGDNRYARGYKLVIELIRLHFPEVPSGEKI